MSQTTQKVFHPMPGANRLGNTPLPEAEQGLAYAGQADAPPRAKQAYIETYGCQMNFSDTEIVAGVLGELGYGFTRQETEADLVLLNTCSIRENAEEKVWNRLRALKGLKRKRPGMQVGLLGCMAERLKTKLLDEDGLVDLVVGPDAYRSLPELLKDVDEGERAVNVLLSREETYADLAPVRLNTNGVSAFVSIMRGCNNMCAFCVVPFTRGRERSRDPDSIEREVRELVAQGYKEVTLLGQNVDSYHHEGTTFAHLLERVALLDPQLRVRFSTSHPKDITQEVLDAMARHANICKHIHLPFQSGNTRILELMNRGHTREWYLELVQRIRQTLPDCAISADVIAGFCSETEAEHQDTLSLMEQVRFDFSFMFYYSERPGTLAARKLPDDVPLEVKKRRLNEIIDLQMRHNGERNAAYVGRTVSVLVEGEAKRGGGHHCGRTDTYKMVVFQPLAGEVPQPGTYCQVLVNDASAATLFGTQQGTQA